MKVYIDLEKFEKNMKQISSHNEIAREHLRKFLAITLLNKVCKN